MVELVDTLDLGPSEATRGGSSPSSRTDFINLTEAVFQDDQGYKVRFYRQMPLSFLKTASLFSHQFNSKDRQ